MEAYMPDPDSPDLPPVLLPADQYPKLLRGQIALVTGASSGIGRSIALHMARAGADVVVDYVGPSGRAEEVAEECRAAGVRSFIHECDVSKEDQVQAMFERVRREFGTLDILVNNAGLQRDAAVWDLTLEDWRKVIDVNLTGQFLCAREAIREFLRRGPRPAVSCAAGKILCISSVHDQIPWAGHVNYAASKGGVMMLMKSMAQECAPHRIRVNSICPGATRTEINRAAWESKEAYRELMRLVPYRRIAEPADIARAAVWLASDESDYLVGASLYIDGGMLLYPGFAEGG